MSDGATRGQGKDKPQQTHLEALVDRFFHPGYLFNVVAVYRGVTSEQCRLVLIKSCPDDDGPRELPAALFRPTEMCTQRQRSHFLPSIEPACSFVNHEEAQAAGLKSAALFRYQFEDESVVVAFGFRLPELFESTGEDTIGIRRLLQDRAAELALAVYFGEWDTRCLPTVLQLTHRLTYILQTEHDLAQLVKRIGYLVYQAAHSLEETSIVSIWLADHPKQRLHCNPQHVFGPDGVSLQTQSLDFGDGLIGWVAQRRQKLNVTIGASDETLPDDTIVRDQYRSVWCDASPTCGAVVIPLLCQGRLVGAMNLECAAPTRFSQDIEFIVEWFSTHVAAAIHGLQVDELHRTIVECDQVDSLAEEITVKLGNLVEAACAAFFSWGVESQALRLERAEDRPIGRPAYPKPGALYYRNPGVGFTRWSFENRLPLLISDLEAFADAAHPEHDRQIDEFCETVIHETQRRRSEERVSLVELDTGSESRRAWELSIAGEEKRTLYQPLSSNTLVDERIRAKSVMLVPVLASSSDGSVSRQALGVMRFARGRDENPFDVHDLELVQGIARYCGKVLERILSEETRKRENQFTERVVKAEPALLEEEFGKHLEGLLGGIRESVGADVLFVRGLENDLDLTLLAASQHRTESVDDVPNLELDIEKAVPRVVPLGHGPSGAAASAENADERRVYVSDGDDSILVAMRERAAPPEEQSVLSRIRSAAAIALELDGRVVGTIAAMSYDDANFEICHDGDEWRVRQQGIQRSALEVLEYHRHWLARAVSTRMDLERTQRRQRTVTTAVDHLADIVSERQQQPGDFFLAGMVMATHHDSFRFHQAFLAKSKSKERGNGLEISPWKDHGSAGVWSSAWGCADLEEQDWAITNRRSLEDDIRGAMQNSDACGRLAKLWEKTEPIRLIKSPHGARILLRRAEYAELQRRRPHDLMAMLQVPDRNTEAVLDSICTVFGMKQDSPAWRSMQVAMIPLDDENPPGSLLFASNVFFEPEGCTMVQDIAADAFNGLTALGGLFSLAQKIRQRDKLQDTIQLWEKLLNHDIPHMGVKFDLAVSGLISRVQASGGDVSTVFPRSLVILGRVFDALRVIIEAQHLLLTKGEPEEVDIAIEAELAGVRQDFEGFFRAVNIPFTASLEEGISDLTSLMTPRQIRAVATVALLTAYMCVQGDEKAELRGIALRGIVGDEGELKLKIEHWGKNVQELAYEDLFSWQAICDLLRSCNGSAEVVGGTQSEVLSLAVPVHGHVRE